MKRASASKDILAHMLQYTLIMSLNKRSKVNICTLLSSSPAAQPRHQLWTV